MEQLNLSSTPLRETRVREKDMQKKQAFTLKHQLKRQFPNSPPGAYFETINDEHLEWITVLHMDPSNPRHRDFRDMVKDGFPDHWDDEAVQHLGLDFTYQKIDDVLSTVEYHVRSQPVFVLVNGHKYRVKGIHIDDVNDPILPIITLQL